jgi:hypothetical protein
MNDSTNSGQNKQVAVLDNMPPARFNWTGLDPKQMKAVAQAMAMSGMFPDIARDSAKAFVKIMAGQEMGIPPFQAMSDISIIQGKAAAGGNIYASKVKSNPRYDYRVKSWTAQGCEIEFFELIDGKRESIGVSQFDEKDAQRAGLLGKGSWKMYPRNMFFNRAMTAGVRTFCPDALNGVNAYTPEELGSEVDEDGRAIVQSSTSFPDQYRGGAPLGDSPAEDLPDPAEAFNDIPGDDESQESPDEQPTHTVVYQVPSYAKPKNSNLINPGMIKDIRSWISELGWNEAEVATFMHAVIGKDKPATYDEGLTVLEALADELNERQRPQEQADVQE